MNNSKPRHNDWDPCHPGIIHEAAQDVSVSRRRLFQIIASVLVIGAVGIGSVAGLMLSGPEPKETHSRPAGITCITVDDYLLTFIADEIPEEDDELKKRIASHLLSCKPCRKSYEKMSKSSGCKTRPVKATLKPCTVNSPAP